MNAKCTILLALLCGLLSLCSVLAGTSAEGKTCHEYIPHILSWNPKSYFLLCTLYPQTYYSYCSYNYNYSYYTGLAYLEAKGKEEGVVTLPSGLLYKEIRPGNGTFRSIYISLGCCAGPFASNTISLTCCKIIISNFLYLQPVAKHPPLTHPVNGKLYLYFYGVHNHQWCCVSTL